jgi:hypothetical protein
VKQTTALYRKWLAFAIVGLLLTGFGLSLLGEAIISKMKNESFFLLGSAGLAAFSAGLSFFGQAIIFRYRLLKARGREDFARKSAPQRLGRRRQSVPRRGRQPQRRIQIAIRRVGLSLEPCKVL